MGNRSVVNYDGDGLPVVLAPDAIVQREDGLWEVVGEAGPRGPQGEVGPQGIAGDDGPQGVAGPVGATGRAGRDAPMSVVWQDGNNHVNPLVPAGRTPTVVRSMPTLAPTPALPVTGVDGQAYRYTMGPNGMVATPVKWSGASRIR